MGTKKMVKEKPLNGFPYAGMSHRKMLQIDKDYEKAAAAAQLVYVSDTQPGITRVKKGKGFAYLYKDRPVRDKLILERIRKLVLPPAWTRVWICALEQGHLQATGYDQRGRKQYRYHVAWSQLRNQTKFHRLYEFGKALPLIRKKMESDLAAPELTERKVVATVVSLMEHTCIRIGNESYEKIYGSHGLTTLKDKHVSVNGHAIQFSFSGKKGKFHNITLRNKRLARIVQHCRDIPGKELFQYLDEDGNRRPVDSGMINSYIREASGMDFSSRDFRTWAGTLNLLLALCEMGGATSSAECKQHIVQALDTVSLKLGNSRTVCRKYYVHPGLLDLYERNELKQHLGYVDEAATDDGLSDQERILMKILQYFHK